MARCCNRRAVAVLYWGPQFHTTVAKLLTDGISTKEGGDIGAMRAAIGHTSGERAVTNE